ncbi:hypothetical protein FOZ61_003288 [Perkinsus olseni]|uniref:Uncharacterized protein n=1 Tax=Perkinsus olseni TaxID=32597 RepID=A0A7J6ME13_PEROL|nr:hypothetical protein FOZ61_003288 [Perkinsus olseni]
MIVFLTFLGAVSLAQVANPWSADYLSCEHAHIASKYVSNSQWFQERLSRAPALIGHSAGLIRHVVLFLDAEGSEVAILGGYNFQAEPEIRVIVVEASDPRRYIELEQIFYRNSYVKVAVLGGDWVFAKLDSILPNSEHVLD